MTPVIMKSAGRLDRTILTIELGSLAGPSLSGTQIGSVEREMVTCTPPASRTSWRWQVATSVG